MVELLNTTAKLDTLKELSFQENTNFTLIYWLCFNQKTTWLSFIQRSVPSY